MMIIQDVILCTTLSLVMLYSYQYAHICNKLRMGCHLGDVSCSHIHTHLVLALGIFISSVIGVIFSVIHLTVEDKGVVPEYVAIGYGSAFILTSLSVLALVKHLKDETDINHEFYVGTKGDEQ